jgi:anti-anti-sigma factor
MQITKKLSGEAVELKVEGRLDVYWADHLAAAVDQEIRDGVHHIRLDLSEVAFLSSAGIGVLVRFYRDLKSIHGSFALCNCSHHVLKILELTKLDKLLVARPGAGTAAGEARPGAAPPAAAARQIERAGVLYEIYPLSAEGKLECRLFGDPRRLRGGFRKEHCGTMQFPDCTFAIGLGALGENFEDCRGRFGEFIAAGGAAAFLPTDGSNVPDFLLGRGATVPEVQVCYGIACYGPKAQPFQSLMRFEAKKHGAPVPLGTLLEACLELSESREIGLVVVGESAGLVGAALRRSPAAEGAEADLFEFPRVREWFSFTAERAHTKSVALLAGVAARGSPEGLAGVIRPFADARGPGEPVCGHFHAAAFGYRPVQKGPIELKATIKTLFEAQTLEGILHLVHDDRSLSAAGQSELVRGACWVAPISKVSPEGAGG